MTTQQHRTHRLLSTLEAARYAGVTVDTIRQWVREGTLRVVPVGPSRTRWRFRPEAVDAALVANERSLGTAAAPVLVPVPRDVADDADLDARAAAIEARIMAGARKYG